MADILTPDLCVIGGGSGGLTVAAAARAFDASVILIEKDKMGGDCLNTGCVPSKSLIAAAKHAALGGKAAPFGVAYAPPMIDFGRVHAHIHSIIEAIRPHDSVERFEGLGAKVIQEHARFIDDRTLAAGGHEIRARRFVIAAGSHAAIPPIPGLESVPYHTNESIFELTERPDHLLIIGAGPIGMELAQAYRRLGAKVSVLDMAQPLAKDDPELTAFALRRIVDEGVALHTGITIESVAPKGDGVELVVKENTREIRLTGTHLLIAAGRAPNVADLGLEAAGVAHSKRGIKVTPGLRTSNRRIYAIGDVAGGLQFTHVAGYQAGLVVRSALFGLPVKTEDGIVPWTTYTDPEIANVGLNEAQARERHGADIKIVRWSLTENDRARAERHSEGLIKLIATPKGKILGCGIAAPHAGELICLFAYAMANRMKVGSLVKFIAPYPTLSEMAKRVGTEFYRDKLDSPWLKRWTGLIRKLP